jgi:hypothetical protein
MPPPAAAAANNNNNNNNNNNEPPPLPVVVFPKPTPTPVPPSPGERRTIGIVALVTAIFVLGVQGWCLCEAACGRAVDARSVCDGDDAPPSSVGCEAAALLVSALGVGGFLVAVAAGQTQRALGILVGALIVANGALPYAWSRVAQGNVFFRR